MNKYVPARKVNIVFSGKNFFDTLEKLIDSAGQTIQFQTYIYAEDDSGKRIADALIRAAERKVQVYLLADGFGSASLSSRFIQRFENAGVNFRFFSPWLSSESMYLGRRLHHKIVVVDKTRALVGGINIADKYHGTKDEPPWLDYAVLIEGEVCSFLHKLCQNIYQKKLFRKSPKFISRDATGPYLVRFRRNDWIWKKNEIHNSYRRALAGASESVTIIGSYFLPGFLFRRMLKRASRRGVKINIILTGKSDVKFIRNAERYLYGFLLRNGMRIFEWPNSMMHGKVALVDDDWATIGSFNINQLSLYRSIELNVDIRSKDFVSRFKHHLEEVIYRECIEVTQEDFYKAGLIRQLFYFLSFQYVRLIGNLFFKGKRIAAGKLH